MLTKWGRLYLGYSDAYRIATRSEHLRFADYYTKYYMQSRLMSAARSNAHG
jgi:hypothetical protein